MSYKVRAKEMVFDGLKRQRPGQVFVIEDLLAFSSASMEFVDEKDQKEFEAKEDELLEQRREAMEKVQKPKSASDVGKFKKEVETVPGSAPKAKVKSKAELKAEKASKSDSGKHNVI